MNLRKIFDNLFSTEDISVAKKVAEESDRELDQKIQQARNSTASAIHRVREEVKQSHKVIRVAEQAIRTMKQLESNH